jgi:hypothetical protein
MNQTVGMIPSVNFRSVQHHQNIQQLDPEEAGHDIGILEASRNEQETREQGRMVQLQMREGEVPQQAQQGYVRPRATFPLPRAGVSRPRGSVRFGIRASTIAGVEFRGFTKTVVRLEVNRFLDEGGMGDGSSGAEARVGFGRPGS